MKRFISILLSLLLVLAVAVISAGAYNTNGDYSKINDGSSYNPEDSYTVDDKTPTCEEAIKACNGGQLGPVQHIYFQLPKEDPSQKGSDWVNKFNTDSNGICQLCVYWWGGIAGSADQGWPSGKGCSWAGYRTKLVDAENRIYEATVPANGGTPLVIWNNGVNGGLDSSKEIFNYERQLALANIEGAYPGDYDTLPEGTPYEDNMDGCIQIIDYSVSFINPLTDSPYYGSNWYVYYGDGCYGEYAVTSDHFVSKHDNCKNPEHLADPDKYHRGTGYIPQPTTSGSGTSGNSSGSGTSGNDGLIYFDAASCGWTGRTKISFYIYEIGGRKLTEWGATNRAFTTHDGDLWAFDAAGKGVQPGKEYGLIFYDIETGAQTYDLLFNSGNFGDIAYVPDVNDMIVNPVDSNKKSMVARWKNSGNGPIKQITSLGMVVGESIPANTSAYRMFVNFLASKGYQGLTYALNFSGKDAQTMIDDIAKALGLTQADVIRAIAEARNTGANDGSGDKTDWSRSWSASRSPLPEGGSSGSAAVSYPRVSVEPDVDGLEISWTNTGANWYRVYYYGRNGWTRLADVRGTSYVDTDVRSGGSYTYTVRALSNDRSSFTSSYDHTGVVGTYYTAPDFSVSNAEDGVRISWSAVSGVPKYRVYYRGANGWTKLTDTMSTSFVDTDVRSGSSYTYTVRGLNKNATEFRTGFRAGKSIRFLTAPKFSLSNAEDGIRISWPSVTGAAKYRIYYYGANGWRRMVDTYNTSYIDTDVRSGSSYTYTVRCITADGSDVTSDYRVGKSIQFLTAPRFSLSNAEDGIRISWPSVTGAVKYRIYYYGANGWRRMVDTASTSYVDTDVRSGNSYTYTVRCITADGSEVTSDYRVGKSIRFVMAPEFSLTNASNGVRISWPAVSGAVKYRVYYRSRNGWTKLTETTSTSVIDTDVRAGANYTYTVRCITADGSSFTSDYRVGKSITYTPAK